MNDNVNKIKISAIVPTYNGAKLIGDTLRSLKSQSLSEDEYEIIAVIDGSRDNTEQVIASINKEGGKTIHSICLKENGGLHNARHAGARVASGDILAYTDDDAVCDRNWLFSLLKEYKSEDIACAGGKILPKWQSPPPHWMKLFDSWTLSLLDYGETRKELAWPENIFGCNFSVRKNILYKLGGFNPECMKDRWVGDGEAGLIRRIHAARLKVVYAPEAVVWHIVTNERVSLEGMKKRYANYAAAHSCSDFKMHRPGKLKLISSAIFFFMNSYKHRLLGWKDRFLKKDLYYFRQALASYNKNKSLYEFKLVFDKKLIELVNREDWING